MAPRLARAAWTRPALFWVDDVPAGGEVVLDGPEGRHAADVRRVRAGEVVLLGDGAGTRARAEVVDVAKGRVTATVLERRRDEEPALRVVLAQALVKGDRGELAVETGHRGRASTRCCRGAPSAAWPAGTTARAGRRPCARWRTTAREAAKQARRARRSRRDRAR